MRMLKAKKTLRVLTSDQAGVSPEPSSSAGVVEEREPAAELMGEKLYEVERRRDENVFTEARNYRYEGPVESERPGLQSWLSHSLAV